jgi:hypothetical protein
MGHERSGLVIGQVERHNPVNMELRVGFWFLKSTSGARPIRRSEGPVRRRRMVGCAMSQIDRWFDIGGPFRL